MPARSDRDAYEPLMRAMDAASRRSPAEFTAALDEAETHLPVGRFHKARPEIQAARDESAQGEWDAAWLKTHHALCGLTTHFPPDLSACPPAPSQRNETPVCPACSGPLGVSARFCPACGTPVPA